MAEYVVVASGMDSFWSSRMRPVEDFGASKMVETLEEAEEVRRFFEATLVGAKVEIWPIY